MEVWKKQCLLAYLGYLPYQDIDDVYGNQTRGATEAFQHDYQMKPVDGVYGDGTHARVIEVIATGEKPLIDNTDDDDEEIVIDGSSINTALAAELEARFKGIRHWTPEEFGCRCKEYHAPYCNGFPVLPDRTLLELVDDIREKAGAPGIRSSGIRCYQHNIDSNGVANSKHRFGKALDFMIVGMSGEELLALCLADPRTSYAYIITPGEPYVHVDVK